MADIATWLARKGLGGYATVFRDQRIDFDVLDQLGDGDLEALGLPLGDRLRLRRALATPDAGLAATSGPTLRQASVAADGERRLISILFLDLVGSTERARDLGLEAYRDLIRAYQSCFAREIRQARGHLASHLGDGVMAWFGFPQAAEDDAERAVTAALAIATAIERLAVPGGAPLQVRAGVATGDVLIGDLTEEWRAERGAVVGDTPNLAARLQASAPAGGVLVCAETRDLLGRRFRCTDAGLLALKGFAAPVQAWRVDAATDAASRFERRRRGDLSPLVGRDDERQLLARRWQTAAAGEGQVVLIQGEAGIGKSRLAEDLADRLRDRTLYRLTFQCLAEHGGSPLHPVIAQMRRAAAQLAGADAAPAERLAALAHEAGLPVATAVPLLARLMDIDPGPAASPPNLPAETLRERTGDLLLDQIHGLARRRPVLAVFEDLHWADPSTRDLLDRLIAAIDGHRILLIGTSRQEDGSGWTGLPNVTTLTLGRLGRRAAADLLHRLAPGGNGVETATAAEILRRTDGVPLFLEEMVRLAVDRPAGAGGAALPASLRELLSARLDGLDVPRELISVCAAIGQEFPARLVAAVTGRPLDRLRAPLDALVAGRLVVARGAWPDTVYRFRHVLFRDIAYDLMLDGRRRVVHGAIATALRDTAPETVRRAPDVVARHAALADRPAAAIGHYRAAARRAVDRSADAEAIGHLEAALGLLDRLPARHRAACEIGLRRALRLPLERHAWGSDAIAANLERLYALQREGGNDRDLFALLHGLFGRHLIAGDPATAATYLPRLEAIAARADDPGMRAMTAHKRGMVAFQTGDFAAAIAAFDRCLADRETADTAAIRRYYPPDPWAVALAMRAWARALAGQPASAVDTDIAAAHAAAEIPEDDFSRSFVDAIIGSTLQALDRPEAARTAAADGLAAAHEADLPYWQAWCRVVHGWATARLAARDGAGPPPGAEAGIEEIEAGIAAYRRTGARQIMPYAHLLLADACRHAGRPHRADAARAAAEAAERSLTVRFHRAPAVACPGAGGAGLNTC